MNDYDKGKHVAYKTVMDYIDRIPRSVSERDIWRFCQNRIDELVEEAP